MDLKRLLIPFILSIPALSPAETWKTYTTADGLADPVVRTVLVDPSGSKWFGTENGLTRFDGSKWTTYRKEDGVKKTLAGNRINDMAYEVGYGPELWIGTDSGVSVMGIKVDGVSFATPYTKADRPLVSDMVRSVAVDSLGIKWFGTDKGISLFNSTEWDTIGDYDLSSTDILAIGYDKNTDTTFIGTRGGGVSRVSIKKWDAVTTASPYESLWASMPSDTVTAVFIEKNGWQWFGTTAGLGFHRGTETKQDWTYFHKDSGLADERILAVTRDSTGLLWVGTRNGASSYDGLKWKTYTMADGLAGNVVYDIAVDLDGSLWFGTDAGLSHLTGFSGVREQELPVPAPERSVLDSNYPNPFNPSTIIPFTLAEPAEVSVEVVDCTGRCVRVLAGGRFTAGCHAVSWPGLTNAGLEAPAGVYMVLLRARGGNWAEFRAVKIVLVR
jgi:ligand-binding sensor domain-containing protein